MRVVAAREDGAVVVRVIDHGPGVPAEERERIFERFVRGASTNAAKDGVPIRGSGIGLALVKHIAESHGGTVERRQRGSVEGSTLHHHDPRGPPERAYRDADAPSRH